MALTLMLGMRPPRATARVLTGLAELFDIAPSTMRVAISRMVSVGDLVLEDGLYALADRHVARQRVLRTLIYPDSLPYDGTWRMTVVTDRGRPLSQRTALRSLMLQRRYGELREGVWMRPATTDGLDALMATADPDGPALADFANTRSFETSPADDQQLCEELWDLPQWAADAERLLMSIRGEGPRNRPIDRLSAATGVVSHLCTDPLLPPELAPPGWPADLLREAYEGFRRYLYAECLASRDSETEHLPTPDTPTRP